LSSLTFVKISEKDGTNKKIQGDLVVNLPGFNSCINFCHLHTLALANVNSPFPDNSFCKSNGYYLKTILAF
jgi:hypothetical protein